MNKDESQHPIIDSRSPHKNNKIVPLRPVITKKAGKPQILRRRPIVINNNSQRVWEMEPERYYYRDGLTDKRCSCSFSIQGGVVIVYDHSGQIVEAYKLKEGEHVVTVLGE